MPRSVAPRRAAWRRSRAAGRCPQVDPAVLRVAVYLCELVRVEVELLQSRHVLLELLHAARAEQRGGDALVAQRPGDRQLGERLSAPAGDLVQRAHAREVL